ncbi:patatin-like protein 3 [Zingiber officinale]|uniref:patatin-like protein 3 n=1 Tax=Zingiber officinale TaxID=94328 RepID=UPI001C4C8765|nr:patatin-like protein 3 [Zingiber officinale]
MLKAVRALKFVGEYLHSKIQLLGNTNLSQTLTNIVIPSVDRKVSQPIIFSTYESEENPLKNALLSGICISTSAAPTYLPGHYFETQDDQGTTKRFNLIDGGVAANNPTLSAISQVTKQILKSNTDFKSYEPVDYSRFLVISIGTGTDELAMGLLGWLYNRGKTPLIDIFSQASSGMVDIYAAVVFQALGSEGYLRIQDDTLTGDAASVDKSTEKNLKNLVEIGKKLLQKPVSMVNLETGHSEPVVDEKGGTTSNGDRLGNFAKKLSDERKHRQGRKRVWLHCMTVVDPIDL